MASAKRKRNIKTHPLVRGERDPDDSFVPPDRQDQVAASENDSGRPAEMVDFSKTETVDTGTDKDEGGKGDGEGGGDREIPPSQVERRTDAAAPAPARRAEREDRAQRRQARDDGEGGDGEGDGDDRRYSRAVRKRIARERAIVNRERALREQADKELAEERTARQELAERVLNIERTSTQVAANADVKALEAQIEALIPQIKAATEAGETARALELQIKLGDLQGDLKVKKYDLTLRAENARIVTENERKAKAAREEAAKRAPAGGSADAAYGKQRSDEFIRANRRWWRKDKEAQQAAIDLDGEILQDISDGELNFEPWSDEHFEELAERLHEEYPDLEIRDLEREPYEFEDDDQGQDQDDQRDRTDRRGARVANNRQAARPVNGNRAPQGRLGQGRREANEVELARQGKVILTEEDFAEMRTFKLDPNNPEHKKYFAKERARTILARAANAEGGR